jgi:hypothetical protein
MELIQLQQRLCKHQLSGMNHQTAPLLLTIRHFSINLAKIRQKTLLLNKNIRNFLKKTIVYEQFILVLFGKQETKTTDISLKIIV